MEDFVERSLLFDFYGELLTEHQRKVYAAIVFEDYSVSEVAREEGISRQGVHDLMKRCDRLLVEYEERLHLVERFVRIRDRVREIRRLAAGADASAGTASGGNMTEIDRIAAEILKEL